MWKLKIAEGEGPWMRSRNNFLGRQVWEFDPNSGTTEEIAAVEKARQEFRMNRFNIKQSSDLLVRIQYAKKSSLEMNLPPIPIGRIEEENKRVTKEIITLSLRRATAQFSAIQAHDGHWPGDFSGCNVFTPVMVMGLYITGALDTILTTEHKLEISRYAYNHQNEDGGWPIHIEGQSTMFASVLQYIMLRLLGAGVDGGEGSMEKGRKWILDHGGAVGMPAWGKFWLTILGLYEWCGTNPLPPEMWGLPSLLPIHPSRLLVLARMVFLPMSYLYGKRFVGPITKRILELRQEIYTLPYDKINWDETRNACAQEDLYNPHPLVQDVIWATLNKVVEPILMHWPCNKLREKALKNALRLIHNDDESTNYVSSSGLSKPLNMICCWEEDPNSNAFKLHLPRVLDFLWLAEDGMRGKTTDGCQLWEVAFAIQAIFATGLHEEFGPTLKKAHNFIKGTQITENIYDDICYRHITKGGWPFSTSDHGYILSDCSGEALEAALLLSQISPKIVGEPIIIGRVYDAVNVLLSLINKDGGVAIYESVRAYSWLKHLNPCETFGDIIIDHTYVECTASLLQALASFRKLYPGHRSKEVDDGIERAAQAIEKLQEPDGSWYGLWGICFTYGTWFGVRGLIAAGRSYQNSVYIRKACDFLLSKQLDSGGWGESYLSCENKVYTNLEGNRSHAVNTSWALLALIDAGQAKIYQKPLHDAAKLLLSMQMENGEFPQQEIRGIIVENIMLAYSSYRNVFPIWALAEYRNRVLQQKY